MKTEMKFPMDVNEIQTFLPHRAPFLRIDRVLEIHASGKLGDLSPENNKVGTKVTAIKNVTFNEPHLQGHFPGFAIMPGVLITEAMAQTSVFAAYPYMLGPDFEELTKTTRTILAGVDHARFRRPVVPGDTLRIESTVTKVRGSIWMFDCVGQVDGKKVAEAQLIAHLEVGGGPSTKVS